MTLNKILFVVLLSMFMSCSTNKASEVARMLSPYATCEEISTRGAGCGGDGDTAVCKFNSAVWSCSTGYKDQSPRCEKMMDLPAEEQTTIKAR